MISISSILASDLKPIAKLSAIAIVEGATRAKEVAEAVQMPVRTVEPHYAAARNFLRQRAYTPDNVSTPCSVVSTPESVEKNTPESVEASRVYANKEYPSGIVIPLEDSSPLSPSPIKFDDPYDRVKKDDSGKLVLKNGFRQHWLDRFDGDDKRLDLALDQAAGYIQENSRRPLEAQVSSQLARIAGEKHDRDQRYAAASKANQKPDQSDEMAKHRAILDRLSAQGVAS